jgi:predicted DNA-binding transcriptional regulator AlpA
MTRQEVPLVNKHTKHKSKKYLRKKAVADRYGVAERTVDRMAADKRLPPPMYRGKFPLWDEDALDASDRAAALLPRPPDASAA